MTHGSLFNGIGGFQLSAEWMGWENVMSCEIDDFCNRVTKYHFPNCTQYYDIKETDFTIYKGRIDILSGGFPCQPFSVAGKQRGTEDERYLWDEMLRAIREIEPRWIVGENVYGLLNWSGGLVFEQVCSDLEAQGYEVQPVILPACGVNAPHRRDRIWFIAHSCNYGYEGGIKGMQEASTQGYDEKDMPSKRIQRSEWRDGLPRPKIFRNDDGLSERLVGITLSEYRTESIKGFGNAIVPQVALQIFKAIEKMEEIYE